MERYTTRAGDDNVFVWCEGRRYLYCWLSGRVGRVFILELWDRAVEGGGSPLGSNGSQRLAQSWRQARRGLAASEQLETIDNTTHSLLSDYVPSVP
jgi:hypothetical protein